MKQLFVLPILALVLMGCDVNPSEFGSAEAKVAAEKLTYVRDERTGLCFALIASRKSGDTSQTGMGLTNVPCNEQVTRLLVNGVN